MGGLPMWMGTLRLCSAWLGLCSGPACMAAVQLPFEADLSDRPAYSPAAGFGFDAANPNALFVDLPEGNYRVTLKFSRERGIAVMRILAEQRRLMTTRTWSANAREVTLFVNVRTPQLAVLPENAAGGSRVVVKPREAVSPTWDERLTLEFDPAATGLEGVQVERIDIPTLHLVGDSTVADQPVPNGSWGQFIPRYFPGLAVANHAESGESLKSFVTSLRLAKLLATLRSGDWVMIQFGHNDQKTQWPQTFADAAGTYRDWLRVYLAEIRARGATPLLVTSPERRNFDTEGRIRSTLAEYAQAMRTVAREEKVAILDLNGASVRIYEALGPALSPRAFADDGNDKTHHNGYGARLLAAALVEELRSANRALTAGLEAHIAPDAGRFDASDPPLPDKDP
jgi:lysophospholipase L1-like esterase